MISTTNKLPFVLFQVKEGLYAVSVQNVREIVILPKVVSIPNVPPEIRGVINLRGKVMPLIDLRTKFGLPSADADLGELIQLLHDRERDHHHWLAELEACVREHRPFKLARDPHACKFGLWYDTYQTDNSLLKMALKKMDGPHHRIHAAADEILQEVERGNLKGALELLAARRNGELGELSKLFEESRRILQEHHRELAVVLVRGEKRFAVSIDLVEAVERIPEENIEPMSAAVAAQGDRHHWRIGKRSKTNQPILLLDEDFLYFSGAAN
jgi:purine-binding chemotaxis protein CheW